MKSAVSLFVEITLMPGSYHTFHYVGERNPVNWFRLPLNFSDAVKACEANGSRLVKNITLDEISINNFEILTFVFFNPEHEFVRSHSLFYRLDSF